RYESKHGKDHFNYVYVDTYQGIKEATEHFIKQGKERIAYIGGDMSQQTSTQRFYGYRDAMLNAGLPIRKDYLIESNFTESGGYISGQKLLQSSAMPEAVVTANDMMAIGFMRACEEANL